MFNNSETVAMNIGFSSFDNETIERIAPISPAIVLIIESGTSF